MPWRRTCSFGQRVGIGPGVVEHHERARSGRCFRPIGASGDALHDRLNEHMHRCGERLLPCRGGAAQLARLQQRGS